MLVLQAGRPDAERPESGSGTASVCGCGLGRDGFHRKCGADIGSGVDQEAAVGRPRRIDRIFPDKRSGRATIDGHAKEVWDAVIVRRRSDRLAVGRPCWSALQVERIGHDPRVRAVGLHHVQERLPVLPDGERDVSSIGGDCRAAKDLRPLSTPQLRGWFRWRASRYSRPCRSQKHREGNSDPVAGRSRCWLSARFAICVPTASVGESAMRKRQSVLRGLASVATRRRPSALAASDVYRSRPESAGGECGARRPCYKATARNHQDRWRDTSASADPTGPDDSRVPLCDVIRSGVPPGWTDAPDVQFVRERALDEVDECRVGRPQGKVSCGARQAQ